LREKGREKVTQVVNHQKCPDAANGSIVMYNEKRKRDRSFPPLKRRATPKRRRTLLERWKDEATRGEVTYSVTAERRMQNGIRMFKPAFKRKGTGGGVTSNADNRPPERKNL